MTLRNAILVLAIAVAPTSWSPSRAAEPAAPARLGPLPIAETRPLLGVPVGAILPYVGPLDALPPEWVPCDGRRIADPDSPLDGVTLPDLTDDRFLMGVGADKMIGYMAGSNELAADGNHSHSGSATNRIQQQAGTPRNLEVSGSKGFQHTHDLSLRASGAHTHGGDSRPAYYAVRFIIRVK